MRVRKEGSSVDCENSITIVRFSCSRGLPIGIHRRSTQHRRVYNVKYVEIVCVSRKTLVFYGGDAHRVARFSQMPPSVRAPIRGSRKQGVHLDTPFTSCVRLTRWTGSRNRLRSRRLACSRAWQCGEEGRLDRNKPHQSYQSTPARFSITPKWPKVPISVSKGNYLDGLYRLRHCEARGLI